MVNNLQLARKTRTSYSTRDIAEIIGVTPPMVSNYENGKNPIRPEQLVKLADLYGCTIDFLLGRIDAKRDEAVMRLLTLLGLMPNDDEADDGVRALSIRDRKVFNLYVKLDVDDKDLVERMIIRLSKGRAR